MTRRGQSDQQVMDYTFGPAYDARFDESRIQKQMADIRALMLDGAWRSLAEIAALTGHPEASVSAQLRHLRKERFGRHLVEKRRRVAEGGTWEYQVQVGLPAEEE